MKVLQDAVTMALTVAIQMGLPVIVLFLIGYLRHRGHSLYPAGRRLHPVAAGAGAEGGVRLTAMRGEVRPCWETQRCPSEKRAACPAYAHPNLPCWRAMKQTLGCLQSHCLSCERFLTPPAK